jgi:hypothetical protein
VEADEALELLTGVTVPTAPRPDEGPLLRVV